MKKMIIILLPCFLLLVIALIKNIDVNDYSNQIPKEQRATTVVRVDVIMNEPTDQETIESIQLDDGTYLGEYDYIYKLPSGEEITRQTFANME